jgi:acyl-CoA reductase-like NAD-dependent aldehyde dehydrogenase
MNNPFLPCINPATGEQFDCVAAATPAEVAQALQEMRQAFPLWSAKPARERVRILKEWQRLLVEASEEITAVISQDTGKSRQDALIELFVAVDTLHQYCRHAPRWLRRRSVSVGLQIFKRSYVEQRPYGVTAVIAPWNYPLLLSLQPLVAALLAGNTVILKPSEETAATGQLISQLIGRTPALAPFVRVVQGDGAIGAALVESAPDLIFITGSTATGRQILQAAARNLTPVITELGGKDAMIVLEDADVAAAARWGVWGAYFNAGQTCMAVERVYVARPVYEQFVRAAVARTEQLKVGYSGAADCDCDFGPLSTARQIEIVKEQLADAVRKGATIAAGGQWDGPFLSPTILLNVDHTMRVMREETFGPVMPIMPVRDEAEAIRLANDSPFGLGASVWSRDRQRAERVAHQIQAASVLINDTIAHFGMPLVPFGGVKQSGNGRAHGKEGLLAFTQPYAYTSGRPPMSLDIATIMRRPGNYHIGRLLLRLFFGVGLRQRLAGLLRGKKKTMNSQQSTVNSQRRTTNDQRRMTNDE